MAFFAMVLLQVNEIQSRMVTTNEAQMETFTLLYQVQQVLSDPVSCSISVGQAFGRVADLHDLAGKPPAKLPSLYRAYKSLTGRFEAVKFLTPGQTIGNGILRISEISLAPRAVFDGQLDVVLKIERLKKGVLGGAETIRKIPVNVDIIGAGYANAFDGIMCLNPSQTVNTPEFGRRMGTALGAIAKGVTDEGAAADSTKKELMKACITAGGSWLESENRCGSGAQPPDTTALQAACVASGGQWDASGHCTVAAH